MPDFNINEFNESMFMTFFNKLPPSPTVCCKTEYKAWNVLLESYIGNVGLEVLNGSIDFEIEVCK